MKCPWAVEGQRVSAWHHIKALDKQVFLTLGIGLSFFQGTEHDWMTVALQFLYMNIIPPTMTLHLDEGSPAYSMTWYLMYHEDMRMIAQRDIFHRQWNDVKGATSGSDLWYVVLLMTVVFNLPFGPWEGGTWFSKVKTMSEEMVKSLGPSNALWTSVYELVCKDMSLEALGTLEHKTLVWEMLFHSEAFCVKGKKVSLRRWFGWFDAAHSYLPLWHVRLLALIALGQSLKVYHSYHDVPLWSSGVTRRPSEIEHDGQGDDSDHDQQEDGSDHGDHAEAAAATVSAEQAKVKADEDKGPVKEQSGKVQLKVLRHQSKNALFVAAAVLSKDNMRFLVSMMLEMCRPLWTEHSCSASECRGPNEILGFYMFQASCSFMTVLESVARTFMDTNRLEKMGFTTGFGAGIPNNINATSEMVQAESTNSFHMFNLFCNLAFHRIGSMLWHCGSWPGKAALLAHSCPFVYDECMRELRLDYRCYLLACRMADASPFIGKLIKASPFRMRWMRELAHIATVPVVGLSAWDLRFKVKRYAMIVFSGWGQTKICEDMFKDARFRERMDSLNMSTSISSYYADFHAMQKIELHNRRDIEPRDDEPLYKGTSQDIFYCKKHEPSLKNARSTIPGHEGQPTITTTNTWPTFSPQSSKSIPADLFLLRDLMKTNRWDIANKTWQAMLLQPRSVVRLKGGPFQGELANTYHVVVGILAFKIVVLWQVMPEDIPKSKLKVFRLGAGDVANVRPTLMTCMDLDEFEVVPSTPVRPLHYWLARKKKIPIRLGVVLRQHGPHVPVLLHEARNAFWDLDLPQLKKLVAEFGIMVVGISLPATLSACVSFFIKKFTNKEVTVQELHDILSLRCSDGDVMADVADEDMLLECLDHEDVKSFQASPNTHS